jgi:hypothetical protein
MAPTNSGHSAGPQAGRSEPGARKPQRILIAYSMSSTYTSTTLDYLLALKRFSNYDVKYVHVTHNAEIDFDINKFDVIINNYCARFPFEGYVSKSYEESLHRFRGLKIIAVQDDYDRTATLHQAIRRLGFHVLLTCIQPEFWHLAYPESELPGIKIIQGLTGYMPERSPYMRVPVVPLAERRVWLAYRGRRLGAKYGRLGFEKEEIGTRMRAICEERGIPHDISVDEASRLYGHQWFEFLGSSRAMLGSESACNAFDFDGDIEQYIEEFRATHQREPIYEDMIDVLAPLERYFDVGQISPRVFECALMRTPMVLFRGRYSGAINADEHYIPLERDFSNADQVLQKLGDVELLQALAERTHERLVQSGRFGYRSLAEQLIETIEEQYPRRINQAWIEFRAATGRPWHACVAANIPSTPEEVRRAILAEQPTDLPLQQSDFSAKQEALTQGYQALADRMAAGSQPGDDTAANGPWKRSRGYRVGRGAWHLLPQGLRYGIAAHVRKLMS